MSSRKETRTEIPVLQVWVPRAAAPPVLDLNLSSVCCLWRGVTFLRRVTTKPTRIHHVYISPFLLPLLSISRLRV
jgi:hypothetical protein